MGIAQANILDAGINIIPASISSVEDRNDFVPTVLPAQAGAALLKEVAECSDHFSLGDTRWMKGNYLVENGLVEEEES